MAYYNLLPKADLYDQLAEEATELAQACLKMSRRLRGANPPRLSEDEISEMITEEFTDVMNVISLLHIESDSGISREKLSRWDAHLKTVLFNEGSWPEYPLFCFGKPVDNPKIASS